MNHQGQQHPVDPTLRLEPVVHVRAPIIDDLYNRGNQQGMIMGGLLGGTIVLVRSITSAVFPDSNIPRIAAFVIPLLLALPLAWLAYWIDSWDAASKYKKHKSEIDRQTLAGRAQLINCRQRLRGKRPWFDANLWKGPPLICYSCSPSDDVLNVQAHEEVDILGGARTFDHIQPFQWHSLLLVIAVCIFLFAWGIPSASVASVIAFAGLACVAFIVLAWRGRAATLHALLPIKMTSCVVSIGQAELTRFGSTRVFTRDDSVLFIEPAKPRKIGSNPARLDVAATFVRRDGHTRRMIFRGAANPCIADLIGRWMYGYELPERLAKRTGEAGAQ